MNEYEKSIMKSATIRKLMQKAEAGTIAAKEMNRLVSEYGRVAGACVAFQLRAEYPDGSIPEADVQSIIAPVIKQMHRMVVETVALMINAQYREAGIGLKAVIPEYDASRIGEMAKAISRRSFKDGQLD